MGIRTPKPRGRPRALADEDIGAAVVGIGFENFSVRVLADRLGVGERTLYRYAPGRDGLIALGLEHLFRTAYAEEPEPAGAGPDQTWREILLELAAGIDAFLAANPAAGAELARGVRAPMQARYLREYGTALMRHGFGPDDALLALHGVFDIVLGCFRDAHYLDAAPANGEPSERAIQRVRLAPGPGSSPQERRVHDAMDRSLAMSPHDWLTARLELLLDGIGVRRRVEE